MLLAALSLLSMAVSLVFLRRLSKEEFPDFWLIGLLGLILLLSLVGFLMVVMVWRAAA